MAVSDRTLLTLMVLALAVTVGGIGTIIYQIGGDFGGLTGFQSVNESFGYVNVSIQDSVAVTMVVNVVDFGTGAVTGGTSGTYVNSSAGTNPSSFDSPGPFHLRNDGTVHVNITINGSSPNTFYQSGPGNSNYTFALENSSATEALNVSCPGNATWGLGNDTFYTLNSSQPLGRTMSPTRVMLCANFSAADDDELNVSILLNISNSQPNGSLNDTVYFFVTSLGHA